MIQNDELTTLYRVEAAQVLSDMAAVLETCRKTQCANELIVSVREMAHKLSGASATVGALQIVQQCKEMEHDIDASANGNVHTTHALIERCRQFVGSMGAVLLEWNFENNGAVAEGGPPRRLQVPPNSENLTGNGSPAGPSVRVGMAAPSPECVTWITAGALDDLALRARLVAQRQGELARHTVKLAEDLAVVSGDVAPRQLTEKPAEGLLTSMRVFQREMRDLGYLISTLNDAIEALRQSALPHSLPMGTSPTRPESIQTPRPRKILVVDDSLIVCAVEAEILSGLGHEVSVCSDGEEALALLGRQPFDLVICDVQMPKFDGFQLVTQIRVMPLLRDIPVILVTGRASPEDVQRGAEVGASGYITKDDLSEDTLRTEIGKLLV